MCLRSIDCFLVFLRVFYDCWLFSCLIVCLLFGCILCCFDAWVAVYGLYFTCDFCLLGLCRLLFYFCLRAFGVALFR